MSILDNIEDSRLTIFISVMIAIITLTPQFVWGQEYDFESEMELGVFYFQNAQYEKALPYFEGLAEELSHSGDEELLPLIYHLCQSCKFLSGDVGDSIPYGEKAIKYTTLPPEYQVQVLKSMLSAYDELAFQDKCVNTINQLNLLWKSYKDPHIIESLVIYYVHHHEYEKVISLENELQHLNNTKASDEIDKTIHIIQLNTIYMGMARSFFETNNFEKSILYLENSLDTLTPYTQENKSTIYEMMADNYKKLGDRKSALKYQKLVIEAEQ